MPRRLSRDGDGAVEEICALARPLGTLAAISFGAELLAGLATLLFGVTQDVSLFVVSRALEGIAAAAGVPALLAHVTDATADDSRLRARAMSSFELSLLAGLAVGGIVGGRLWAGFHTGAFAALALVYGVAAVLPFAGSVGSVAVSLLSRLGPVPPLAPEARA
jgi:MFS family permease